MRCCEVQIEKIPVGLGKPRELLLPWTPNKLMHRSKARTIRAISGDSGSAALVDPIVELRLGSGGTDSGSPIRLTGYESELYSEISSGYTPSDIQRSLHGVDLQEKAIYYGLSLGPQELDGVSISEAGLFTQQGHLYSMKTFEDIPKDQSFYLVITWRVAL